LPGYDRIASDRLDQRYFAGTLGGRFLTADPFEASGSRIAPASWNRYAYTESDPVNSGDPTGLLRCSVPEWITRENETQGKVQCESNNGQLLEGWWDAFDTSMSEANRLIALANIEWARFDETEDDRAILNRAINEALGKLNDPNCSRLFGSPTVFGSFTLTADSVLRRLQNSMSFRFAPEGFPFAGNTSFQSWSFSGVQYWWAASVAVGAGQRNSINGAELVNTVLHELGHVLAYLGFRGGVFVHDDDDETINRRNTDWIWQNCF
jgi:RHS repeat-associated protein